MSKNTTLIIPDIHIKPSRVDKIVKRESPDIVVCLGDYFDPKNEDEDVDREIETAHWFVDKTTKSNWTMLKGNHDIAFEYDNHSLFAIASHSKSRRDAVNKIVKPEHWRKLRYHCIVDGWLLTHAGLSNFHLPYVYKQSKFTLADISTWLYGEAASVKAAIQNMEPHWIFGCGVIRGGFDKCGGLLWCDLKEFIPTLGLKQIFGHSFGREPRWINEENVCLDTGLNHYGLIIDGRLEIKRYSDL